MAEQSAQNKIEQQLFNQDNAQNQQNDEKQDPLTTLVSAISDLDRRLRILEERYSNLRQKMQLTDQNMIEAERSFLKEIHGTNDDVLQMKRDLNDFSDKIIMFGSELETTAKKIDLKVLEKYLQLWNPNNYVTRSELREFLRQKGINIITEEPEEEKEESEEE